MQTVSLIYRRQDGTEVTLEADLQLATWAPEDLTEALNQVVKRYNSATYQTIPGRFETVPKGESKA